MSGPKHPFGFWGDTGEHGCPCIDRKRVRAKLDSTTQIDQHAATRAVSFVDMEVENFLPQFRDAAAKLESVFRDMCQFEFTVQEGKLYVLNARVGRRTPVAALRIATDLFLEGKISSQTLLNRIDLGQVEAVLKPTIIINSKIRELGRGLPASAGAATGVATFSADAAVRLSATGAPAVFLCTEMTPDDIRGLDASVGMVSFVGGMSSHAAVCSRAMGKPCVSGVHWSFDRARSSIITAHGSIREGDPLTIDGTAGIVYAGSADVDRPKALQNDRLLLLLRVIDVLSAEDELPQNAIGKAWRIRDIIVHGSSSQYRPDLEEQLEQWPLTASQPAKAFSVLGEAQIQRLAEELLSFRLDREWSDVIEIWNGLRTCLLRLLSKNVGVGRHPEFWRPLFDPCQVVLGETDSSAWKSSNQSRIQLVGEEFFSISYHVPELIDIATVRIYWAVECGSPRELWRIDRTDPAGEKLLQGSGNLKALKIVVNDATVPHNVLGAFYNSLCRREYFWNWYSANKISRHEIVDAMTKREQVLSQRVRRLAQSAGLISGRGVITHVGESLLHLSTASERARSPVRIGW